MKDNQTQKTQTGPDESEPRIVEMSARINIPISTQMGDYLSRNLETILNKDQDNGR